MGEDDPAVARILRCSDHYEVLQLLPAPQHAVFVDVKQVRRRYKELAIQVHPDKSKSSGMLVQRLMDAEAAFKRLSEAYECLVDEASQRKYLSTVRTGRAPHARAPPQHKRPPPPPPTGPSVYPRKRKKPPQQNERKPPPPPFPPPQREPRRQRTPEEIWCAFQEEEERLASEEFHAKGFERTYAASSSSQRAGGTETGNENSSSMDVEMQETILNSGLDEKARRWATWRQSPKTPAEETTENAEASSSASGVKSSANHKIDPVDARTPTAVELICCLLCQRKFPTHDALGRHNAFSKLHAANLQQQQQQQQQQEQQQQETTPIS
uniref:J domain-containing protein n=1 Tax=Globisporangium ultimum (strain ATCC 200006 / CBS 805.95 / DAOM BR144) TaxID=431595 RepID=K3WUD3_GLOUD